MKRKKQKKEGWGWLVVDILLEIITLPFRIVWYLLRGIGKMFDDIDF